MEKEVCELCLVRDLKRLELTTQILNLKIEYERENSDCDNHLLATVILGLCIYLWLGALLAGLIWLAVTIFVMRYHDKKRSPINDKIIDNESKISEIVCQECLD